LAPGSASAAGAAALALEKAAEAGQRVFENTFRIGPDRKYVWHKLS
jgi:hypothetical protein